MNGYVQSSFASIKAPTLALPPAPTPTVRGTLSERVVLVDHTARQWTAARTDEAVNREVAANHRASAKAGSYRKNLLAGEALKAIKTIMSEAAADHRRRTLPWLDRGTRMLPTAGYPEYAAAQRSYQSRLWDALDDLGAKWDSWILIAQSDLGTLFDPAQYPPFAQVRSCYALGHSIVPLPDASDWRVNLGDAEAATLRAQYQNLLDTALADAIADLASRIRDVVGAMSERLHAYTITSEGVTGAFRDSLVENVRDLAAILPSLNITQDPRIDTLTARIQTDLCRHEPAQLRADQWTREETAAAADAVLDALNALSPLPAAS